MLCGFFVCVLIIYSVVIPLMFGKFIIQVCTCIYSCTYVCTSMYMYMYMYMYIPVFPGVSKSAVNKVKADLEASPKESFSEEELQAVRPFI